MLRRVAGLVVVGLLAFGAPARADYEAGRKALEAGHPAEALSEWRTAAGDGDGRAMLALGRLYLDGVGAPQDYVMAHMWFNLAASRGEAEAARERDALAARMTPEERAEAQKRARSWRPGKGIGGGSVRASAPAAGPPPPRAIREAQTLLAALGYAPGPADGRWGGRTVAAWKEYLRAAGLPASNALTPESLRALRAAAAGRRAADPSRDAVRADAAARAASRGDIAGLGAAVAAGADVNARDARGRTALMHAADKGYVLLVPPLLEAGADPNLRAADGATALFMAAAQGHTDIVVQLMKAGADVSIRGPKGRTAVDAARLRYGNAAAAKRSGQDPAIVALLEGITFEEAAYAHAKAAGTLAAYDDYLSSHAAGRHSGEIRSLRDKLMEEAAYADATAAGTLAAYDEYLSSHAVGHHSGEIRSLRDKLREHERVAREWKKSDLWPAGVVVQDCLQCPELVVVPAGSFTMGSPASEKGRSVDEGPQRRVSIGYRFAVGKYEVTFAEWDACASDGGCGGYRPGDEGWGRGDRPVVNVSWNDAKSYARWLSTKTGERYRLLSEAEWEYAARAGTTGPFHAGETISTDQANYDGNYVYGGGRKGAYRRRTVPVGSFGGNSFGLHDMHGNAWEWVEDCWKGSYAGAAPPDGSAWESGNCDRRVLRGGSWFNDPRNLRSAYRSRVESGVRSINNGFRVARTLAP